MAVYLDFEKKIESIQENLDYADAVNNKHSKEILEEELNKEVLKTFKNLTDFQKLQLARHPDRPYGLDYIKMIMTNDYEIHGDRAFKDDKAMIAYIGYIGNKKAIIIAEQKGRGVKNKIKCNFGMPNPEGYRKALRVVKLAEKFNIPVLFLIDTPGAYPGLGAEERGQSEAIAKNLFEFADIRIPLIAIVIGEGGSGGALAIGVADRLSMMRYAIFSVISPEGCSAILWKDPNKVEQAAKSLKITSDFLLEHKLIDSILEEPLIGAHRNKIQAGQIVKNYFLEELEKLNSLSIEDMLQKRYNKLISSGIFYEKE